MTNALLTKKIAGHKITLAEGLRYIASRPIDDGRKLFTVTIHNTSTMCVAACVRDLPYEAANRLINAFNNGASSFDGRVW